MTTSYKSKNISAAPDLRFHEHLYVYNACVLSYLKIGILIKSSPDQPMIVLVIILAITSYS